MARDRKNNKVRDSRGRTLKREGKERQRQRETGYFKGGTFGHFVQFWDEQNDLSHL